MQRDWGTGWCERMPDLNNTVERVGIDAFRAEVEKRCGFKLGAPRPFSFTSTGDPIGWRQTLDGKAADKKWHLTLYVENGRVKDTPTVELRTALREIAKAGGVDFVVTSNQNLVIANVTTKNKPKIEASAGEGMVCRSQRCQACDAMCDGVRVATDMRASVAESERFLPSLVTDLEEILDKAGLRDDDIVIRMTGCRTGARGLIWQRSVSSGRSPGLYNLISVPRSTARGYQRSTRRM